MTVPQLAALVGRSQWVIFRVETDSCPVPVDLADALALAVDARLDVLLYADELPVACCPSLWRPGPSSARHRPARPKRTAPGSSTRCAALAPRAGAPSNASTRKPKPSRRPSAGSKPSVTSGEIGRASCRER